MVTVSAHLDEDSHFLLVRSGGYRCAIPVGSAKLVTKAPRTHALPGSEPRFVGLAQIAGEPAAIVDLHALLDPGGEPGGGHSLTVVLRGPGGASALGLAVDEAFGVSALSIDQPRLDSDPRWISGRSKVSGREVAVLDPTELFADATSDEKGTFDGA